MATKLLTGGANAAATVEAWQRNCSMPLRPLEGMATKLFNAATTVGGCKGAGVGGIGITHGAICGAGFTADADAKCAGANCDAGLTAGAANRGAGFIGAGANCGVTGTGANCGVWFTGAGANCGAGLNACIDAIEGIPTAGGALEEASVGRAM